MTFRTSDLFGSFALPQYRESHSRQALKHRRLRAAAALVHVVDQTELTLTLSDGNTISVGAGCSYDAHPCVLRHHLVGQRKPATGPFVDGRFDRVVDVRLGGALTETGPGLYGTADRRRYYFATFLDVQTVAELARQHSPLNTSPNLVSVDTRADPGLGVTAVCVSTSQQPVCDALRYLAGNLSASCAVSELPTANR